MSSRKKATKKVSPSTKQSKPTLAITVKKSVASKKGSTKKTAKKQTEGGLIGAILGSGEVRMPDILSELLTLADELGLDTLRGKGFKMACADCGNYTSSMLETIEQFNFGVENRAGKNTILIGCKTCDQVIALQDSGEGVTIDNEPGVLERSRLSAETSDIPVQGSEFPQDGSSTSNPEGLRTEEGITTGDILGVGTGPGLLDEVRGADSGDVEDGSHRPSETEEVGGRE